MAADIKDWSANDLENLMLDDINLSREQGGEVAKLMGAIKRKFDDVDLEIAGVAGAYAYKGTVDTVDDLPMTGNDVGDVYNVTTGDAQGNYAWDGAQWDKTGDSLVDVDGAQVTATGSTTPRTLGARFADVVNVKDYGAKGDGVTDDTAAIRSAFDAALEHIEGNGTVIGATVFFPVGTYIVSDELLSDDFQQTIWSRAFWNRYLTIKGSGTGSTTILVSNNWASGVRNTANGNQRTYGPWANSPSPSILFPFIQDVKNGNPLFINMSDMAVICESKRIGRNPIPIMFRGELNSYLNNLYFGSFANWGEVIMGAYNSVHSNLVFGGCGQQPSECGKVFSGIPAGFNSQAVKFDFDKDTLTVSAKAAIACQGYSAGVSIPFFNSGQIGKTFWLSTGDAGGMPLETVIETVSVDGFSATISVVQSISTISSNTNIAASFSPVKATTTADSAVVTLSAPVCLGRGAQDMVGMLVAIPQAGSKSSFSRESTVFVSRIASCDVGNDTDGYTQVTLTEPAKYSISGEDFICGASHFDGYDERSRLDYSSHNIWGVNDIDWVECRWETSNDAVLDTPSASSYMFVSCSAIGSAVQFTGCKIHGCNPLTGQFACDGSAIIDSSENVMFTGVDFTHLVCSGKGALRFTGKKTSAFLTNVSIGGWRIPKSFKPIYIDPQTDWSVDNFNIIADTIFVPNDSFRYHFKNIFCWNKELVTAGNAAAVVRGSNPSDKVAGCVLQFVSDDDINTVQSVGLYEIAGSKPLNAPTYGEFSILEVFNVGTFTCQRYVDLDNKFIYTRFHNRNTQTWTAWKREGVYFGVSSSFTGKESFLNTTGKNAGALAYNETEGKLYIALSDGPTGDWQAVDGSDTITPA